MVSHEKSEHNEEDLYYKCCDKIDDDIDVAEPFLVGCIAYVIRERGEKGIRRRIRDDLAMSYYTPYVRELNLISCMCDRSIHALITSSIDLSCVLKQITIIYEHAKDSDFELVQPSTHANKAKKAGDMLIDLSEQMKPTTKQKIRTDSSLFAEN